MLDGEKFFRQTRQIFAGILGVFQENLTQYGGKRLVSRRAERFKQALRICAASTSINQVDFFLLQELQLLFIEYNIGYQTVDHL